MEQEKQKQKPEQKRATEQDGIRNQEGSPEQDGTQAQDGQKTRRGPSGEPRINLSDFALFLSVMKVKRAYEDVLGIILDEPQLKLKHVKTEEVVLNRTGRRAIRLDAWAVDVRDRRFDMEMQNDTEHDDVRKRSRFYQGMLDTPVLKAGKKTKYRELPSTVIVFITQEDIFGKDRAMYTFSEWCEEVPGLPLEDGTKKIFLNMSSRNGRPELVSLLQYMKDTTLENEAVTVKDKRLVDLDRIVTEVKESEEWEAVEMSIYGMGIEEGMEQGLAQGIQALIETSRELGSTREETLERLMQKLRLPREKAEEYMKKYWI